LEHGPSDGASAVMKVPMAGGAPIPLASAGLNTTGIAVDAESVYWTDDGDLSGPNGKVMKVPIAGGAPVTLVSGQDDPQAIALDGTNVYWTTAGVFTSEASVMKVARVGGAPIKLASIDGEGPGIAVDAANVYWTNRTGAANGGTIVKVSLGGGRPIGLAGGDSPGPIAVNGTAVFWADDFGGGPPMPRGTVKSTAVECSVPTTIATKQAYFGGLAVDRTSVYWTTRGDYTSHYSAPIGSVVGHDGTVMRQRLCRNDVCL
jgi:hypothetical protein